MVQGGYNAVLTPPDSLQAHLLDTLKGGGFINDQELVWTLVTEAPGRVLELESRYGCLFDRGTDGHIHQKPFAGQTHDRTIHKGDLTGIEIMNRLSEQVAVRANVRAFEECRAMELALDPDGRCAGALVLDQRAGRFLVLRARASFLEIQAGRGTPNGGVWIDVSHLGADVVERSFRGMVRRCRDFGRDLARGPVEVGPTAHFMMGGVVIDPACRTSVEGLFAAGEDTGGVHGANRLGGNGVAESTVFGGIAGDVMADAVVDLSERRHDAGALERVVRAAQAPLGRTDGDLYALQRRPRASLSIPCGPAEAATT